VYVYQDGNNDGRKLKTRRWSSL